MCPTVLYQILSVIKFLHNSNKNKSLLTTKFQIFKQEKNTLENLISGFSEIQRIPILLVILRFKESQFVYCKGYCHCFHKLEMAAFLVQSDIGVSAGSF